MYKVIFNDDEKNYELFEKREYAEKFAKNYCNTKIVEVSKKCYNTKNLTRRKNGF